ncbi:MAG: hypothetical protein HW391_1193 [Chloroflexi bacterium]|nr:hypothetical protein [Chloroflexota bacterium]
MVELTLPQLSGLLLIAGAAIFWSVIVGAIVSTMRTGSLPFKDPSTVPALEFYQSISAKPRWWRAINLVFSTGIVVTALGLTVLQAVLDGTSGGAFSQLGLVLFLVATTLWVGQLIFNLSMTSWAASEVERTGTMPPTSEAWPLAFDRLVNTYMVLAYLATALFGAGILTSELLPGWAGWLAVVAGLAGAASVSLTGARAAIPLLIHVVPAILGVLLLNQSG